MLPSNSWAELTTADLDLGILSNCVAVLPVAATEQHGPHLPLGTDSFIMRGYLERVLARLPADLAVVVLPLQEVGCSIEHQDFPGTLSFSAHAALSAWADLLKSVARAGCRKLVIVNSHGGNSSVINSLAHEMRASLKMLVVMAAWQRFGYPKGLFSNAEHLHGIHGGAIETALMLAFRPDLVRRDKIRDFKPASLAMEQDFTWLRAGRPTGFGWMAQDLSAEGAMGDATTATAAQGEVCADHGADAFITLLREVAAFDLARLVDR